MFPIRYLIFTRLKHSSPNPTLPTRPQFKPPTSLSSSQQHPSQKPSQNRQQLYEQRRLKAKEKKKELYSQFERATNKVRRKLEATGIHVDARKPVDSPSKNLVQQTLKRKAAVAAAATATLASISLLPTATPIIDKPKIVIPTPSPTASPPPVKIPTTIDGKPILLSLPLSTLSTLLPAPFTDKPYRIKQLHEAIYKHGTKHFSDITVFSQEMRKELQEGYEIGRPESIMETLSADGTKKCLLGFGESVGGAGKPCVAAKVECVYMPSSEGIGTSNKSTKPEASRIHLDEDDVKATLCKMLRNLEPWEMVSQVMHGMKIAGDFGKKAGDAKVLTNIVLMGQGEPLHNYKSLYPFIKTLTRDLGFHPSKITLSTSGIAPLIPKIATDLECSLAISLHATNDELRSRIMPINKQYPLSVLMESIRQYIYLHGKNKNVGKRHKRVTFEYVMLKGVNDSVEEAGELVRLLKSGLKLNDMKELASLVHVNLIPFHGWEGSGYECSEAGKIDLFRQRVVEGGVNCHVRVSRGLDVLGACGQLRSMNILKARRFVVNDDE
ncbi:UNVERIFIED_CONTAM: hypothetical protein HDU68_005277 [Siphonaria sp. JEL0065]|nr:hypothetical protein HDU68_005277 [Siphonaria sp. JEL0065]